MFCVGVLGPQPRDITSWGFWSLWSRFPHRSAIIARQGRQPDAKSQARELLKTEKAGLWAKT